MNKRAIILILCLVLAALVAAGCAAPGSANKLTLAAVQSKYPAGAITQVTPYQNTHVLVESQKEGFPPQFDWFDLRTGDSYTMPATGDFVSLVTIVDENHLRFLSSGRTDLTYFRVFPYLVDCQREAGKELQGTIRRKYFAVSESTEFGSKEDAILTAVQITDCGAEIHFGPIQGQELGFFAAAATIPPARTAYETDNNRLIVTFTGVTIGDNVTRNIGEGNEYIRSVELQSDQADVKVIINLTAKAKFYNVEINNIEETQMPYAVIRFAE